MNNETLRPRNHVGFILTCLLAHFFAAQVLYGAVHTVSNGTELQAAMNVASDGDSIVLAGNHYGSLDIVNRQHNTEITISSAQGAEAVFDGVQVHNSRGWILRGLSIKPRFTSGANGNYAVYLDGENLVLEDSIINYADDTSGWTAANWLARTGDGATLIGTDISLINNTIANVDHGINAVAANTLISRNTIMNFRGDGIRTLENGIIIEYNTIKNCYAVDANHDDGIQSWSTGPGGVGTGEVRDVIIRGNTILNNEDPNQPLLGSMQGIGLFDGTFVNWRVENNVIITDQWHGITFLGVRDSIVINNTVLDTNDNAIGPPWIQMGNHKDGTPPSGCIVRNNLSTAYNSAPTGVLSDFNVSINQNDLEEHFVSPSTGDYRLKDTSPAVDAGSSESAPSVDIAGNVRPAGAAHDAGAYEFNSNGNQVPRPSILPGGGNFAQATTVTLSTAIEDASIRYTMDGTDPTLSSSLYISPIVIDQAAILKARGFKDGLEDSEVASAQYTFDPPSGEEGWHNTGIQLQSAAFQVAFDAVPLGVTDSLSGLSNGAAGTFANNAAIVRFSPSGIMDVRNGSTYSADVQLNYTVGTTYHIRMLIDITTHSYSVFVTPESGTEVQLASNYAFRSEQAAVSQLNNFATFTTPGSPGQTLANLSIEPIGDNVAPAPPTNLRLVY